MKLRIFIIAGLAVLLVAIAFVRAIVSHQDEGGGLNPNVAQSVPLDILNDYIEKEDALRRIDSVRLVYTDSLNSLQTRLASLDSIAATTTTDSLRAVIKSLQNNLSTSEKKAADAKQARRRQFEKLVSAFYKGEKSRLPADLSEYERDVSLKEIRAKAMTYFDLSAKELNRIIANNK